MVKKVIMYWYLSFLGYTRISKIFRGLILQSRLFRMLLKYSLLIWGLIRRPMTLGVKALITDEDGKIFLVRHTYIDGWHLPGGGVERKEDIYQTVAKEVLEECNILLTTPPKLYQFYKNIRTSRFDHVALFVCEDWQSQGEKVPDFEIAEFGFFARSELPTDTSSQTLARLAEIYDGQPVSAIW